MVTRWDEGRWKTRYWDAALDWPSDNTSLGSSSSSGDLGPRSHDDVQGWMSEAEDVNSWRSQAGWNRTVCNLKLMNWLFLEFSVGYFQITFDWGPLIWQQTKLWMGGGETVILRWIFLALNVITIKAIHKHLVLSCWRQFAITFAVHWNLDVALKKLYVKYLGTKSKPVTMFSFFFRLWYHENMCHWSLF